MATKRKACTTESRSDALAKASKLRRKAQQLENKGLLIDMRQARAAVDTARQQAEKEANVAVGEVLLAISGGHIQTRPGEGRTPVRDGEGKVTRDDLDELRHA